MGLFELFSAGSDELVGQLDGQSKDHAERVLRERLAALGRPYSDQPGVTDLQVRCARAGLEAVSDTLGVLSAANASAELVWVTDQVEEQPKRTWRDRYESVRRFLPTGGIVMLLLNTVLCVGAAVLLVKFGPVPLNILLAAVFGVLALINLLGIPIARRPKMRDGKVVTGPGRTPHAVLHAGVTGPALVAAVGSSLKRLDRLLTSVADSERGARHEVEQGRGVDAELSIDLLQAIAAGSDERMAKPGQWAESAVALLDSAGLRVVAYDGTNAHLFDERPSGGDEIQMRLPALLDASGTTAMRRGVLLVPIDR